MIISISKSTDPHGKYHSYMVRHEPKSLGEFMRIITTRHWSAILWRDDIRRLENFESASLCVLDFDDGAVTMRQFMQRMEDLNYWYVVGPSKSHMKVKYTQAGKELPAVDRFRAVLKFSEPITDAEQYSQNMRRIQQCFYSDHQACHGSIKFAPCTAIAGYGVDGERHHISVRPKKQYTKYVTSNELVYSGDKSVPVFVRDMLHSATPGNRNSSIYKAARSLRKRHFNDREVYSVVKSANIDLEEQEIKNTIRSAFR